MVSLLTAASISALNPSSPSEYLLFTLTLAFLVGLVQFVLGALKFGFVVNFLSHPVINGFTSAAAIIIGLSQVKHLFRIKLPSTEHIQEAIVYIAQNIGDIHWLTFGIGLTGIIIIKYGKKIHKSLPTPLIAVVFGILAVSLFDLGGEGVKVLGAVPSGLPTLSSPSFDMSLWATLFPIALTISLVGFAESYAVAKTIHGKHKNYKLDANQELIGLGMANFGAAFFKGYPVTGGFSRTAVNDQAGAKTALASIISVVLIVLTLLFFTSLFYNLPNAILAAVVLVAVSGLIDFKTPKTLWKNDKMDFIMLMATFIATLTLGIETGIISGMVLSLLAVIYKASRPHIAVLAKVPGTNHYRNIERFSNLEKREDLIIIRIDGPIYFANVDFIKKKIEKILDVKKNTVKSIILNMESVTSLDSSGAHELEEWINTWKTAGIQTSISGTRGPIRDILHTWGIIHHLGDQHVFTDDATAVDFFDNKIQPESIQELSPYALESKKKFDESEGQH
jgi:SulP family sulfate permease